MNNGGISGVAINLRQAIIQRVNDKSTEELHEVIQISIYGEDRVLPGLGVLFEMIWEHSEPDVKIQLVQTLHQQLHK
jgi:small acid-soluble spore protein I (minor)